MLALDCTSSGAVADRDCLPEFSDLSPCVVCMHDFAFKARTFVRSLPPLETRITHFLHQLLVAVACSPGPSWGLVIMKIMYGRGSD